MAGIRFFDPFSGALDLQANNGITNNAGTLQLGGALIQNTALTGAFRLSISDAAAGFAVGATASATHKIYGLNTITVPTNGTAAGLFQTAATPAANVTGTVNIYGSASTLDLTLTAASVNTAVSVNITGHLASLVLRGGAAQSTGILSATRATLNIFDAVNAADIRIIDIKTPEVSGTGATITALHGLYIQIQKIAAATTAYAIYQVGANDLNYFAGASTFAASVTANTLTSMTSVSADSATLNSAAGSAAIQYQNAGSPIALTSSEFAATGGSKLDFITWVYGANNYHIYTNGSKRLTVDGSGNTSLLGALQPASLANAAAPNNSIYYSTDASKLVYKDAGGVVNNLY